MLEHLFETVDDVLDQLAGGQGVESDVPFPVGTQGVVRKVAAAYDDVVGTFPGEDVAFGMHLHLLLGHDLYLDVAKGLDLPYGLRFCEILILGRQYLPGDAVVAEILEFLQKGVHTVVCDECDGEHEGVAVPHLLPHGGYDLLPTGRVVGYELGDTVCIGRDCVVQESPFKTQHQRFVVHRYTVPMALDDRQRRSSNYLRDPGHMRYGF